MMPTIPNTFGEENKRKQNPTDFYETPIELARRGVELALSRFRYWHGGIKAVLDPALGTGVYVQAMRDVLFPKGISQFRTFSLDIERRKLKYAPPMYYLQEDFTKYPTWRHEGGPKGNFHGWPRAYDLIVTNPPFSLAEEYVQTGYELLKLGGVMALLLKAEFYCGQGRSNGLFQRLNPTEIVVPYRTRVSFDGSGKTNTIDHVYYIWVREMDGVSWDTTITWQREFQDWKVKDANQDPA